MFSSDGNLLPCTDKAAVMRKRAVISLKTLIRNVTELYDKMLREMIRRAEGKPEDDRNDEKYKVIIIDGMAGTCERSEEKA